MPDLDFSGLRSTSQAAFKTDFADVAGRWRRRRRRQVRVAGAALAVAVVATGIGVKDFPQRSPQGLAAGLSGVMPTATPPFIPSWQPSQSPTKPAGHDIKVGVVRAGDLSHLYVRYNDCRYNDCTLMFAATADAGAHWARSALPVPHDSMVDLFAVAPRTVLAWYQVPGEGREHWLSTADGGAHWRPVNVATVAVLPPSWQVLPQDFEGQQAVSVLAADPVTGDVARLAPRPLPGWRLLGGLPVSAGLWLTGASSVDNDPPGGGPATFTGGVVEVSHDGGRTWQRYTLPDPVTGVDQGNGAAVATADGKTAYVVGQAGGFLRVYGTTDGGVTWQREAGQVRIGSDPRRLYAALRPDGTLTIQVGDQAPDHPTMYESADGGRTLQEVPVGPGAAAVAVPGGYAQSGWPNASGVWMSTDGTGWTYAAPPA